MNALKGQKVIIEMRIGKLAIRLINHMSPYLQLLAPCLSHQPQICVNAIFAKFYILVV